MRERLKSAITRASQLEQELADLKSNHPLNEGKSTPINVLQKHTEKLDVGIVTDASYDPSKISPSFNNTQLTQHLLFEENGNLTTNPSLIF